MINVIIYHTFIHHCHPETFKFPNLSWQCIILGMKTKSPSSPYPRSSLSSSIPIIRNHSMNIHYHHINYTLFKLFVIMSLIIFISIAITIIFIIIAVFIGMAMVIIILIISIRMATMMRYLGLRSVSRRVPWRPIPVSKASLPVTPSLKIFLWNPPKKTSRKISSILILFLLHLEEFDRSPRLFWLSRFLYKSSEKWSWVNDSKLWWCWWRW